jgi:putative Ca2+/H+ antiporter (TMEM165/GDT1 family)
MIKLVGVFLSVFLAELGDKTQVAVLLFSASGDVSRLGLFLVASLALIASTGIAVLIGGAAEQLLSGFPLKLIAGLVFIGIGVFYVIEHFRAPVT